LGFKAGIKFLRAISLRLKQAAILLNRLRQVVPSGKRMRDLLSLTASIRLASGLALLLDQSIHPHQNNKGLLLQKEEESR
jgi:hypothetical protein